jgi:hypothetical protein
MTQASCIQNRLRQAASMPETLAAAFDAFEAIRIAARSYQDQVPALFAAFMTVADAAVDGREAITVAPSLPPDGADVSPAVPADADTGQAADCLAALAAALSSQLTEAASLAGASPDDQAACQDAAAAATRICQLMTRPSP